MPKMVPVYGVTVVRDGISYNVTPGVAFDFTPGEIKEIRSHNHDYLRKPVNESSDTVALTETDLSMHDKPAPEADAARDANVLSAVQASGKTGGPKKTRNQGGGLAESRVSEGKTNNNDEQEPDAPEDGADDL